MLANMQLPDERPRQLNAIKLMMYIYLAATFMAFAGLTSAYIVSKSDGNWRPFVLPTAFYINTLILILSSGTAQLALISARNNQINRLQLWLFATALLAVAFVFGQLIAWQKLVAQGVFLVGSASGGFLYIFSGLHALHIIGGFIALVVILVKALMLKISASNRLSLQLFVTFWHAMDFLWIYLFVFLLVNQS